MFALTISSHSTIVVPLPSLRLHLRRHRRESDLTKEFETRSRARLSRFEWKARSFVLRRRDTKEPRASLNRFSPSLHFCRSVAGNDPLFRSLEFLLTHYAGARSTSAGPYFIFRNGGPATGKNRYRFDRSSPSLSRGPAERSDRRELDPFREGSRGSFSRRRASRREIVSTITS